MCPPLHVMHWRQQLPILSHNLSNIEFGSIAHTWRNVCFSSFNHLGRVLKTVPCLHSQSLQKMLYLILGDWAGHSILCKPWFSRYSSTCLICVCRVLPCIKMNYSAITIEHGLINIQNKNLDPIYLSTHSSSMVQMQAIVTTRIMIPHPL